MKTLMYTILGGTRITPNQNQALDWLTQGMTVKVFDFAFEEESGSYAQIAQLSTVEDLERLRIYSDAIDRLSKAEMEYDWAVLGGDDIKCEEASTELMKAQIRCMDIAFLVHDHKALMDPDTGEVLFEDGFWK